ncbi:MAG: hypothetical protein ACQGVK_11715 [Myxococcota bacterium]
MRRSSFRPAAASRFVALVATWLLGAFGDAPRQAPVEPFSWEQVGRIDAGVRSGPAATELSEEELPLWV